MTNLVNIDVAARIRRYMRMKFLQAAHDTIEADRDMVGYVIVTWDRHGVCTTTVEARYSPIPGRFAATIAKDALDRRITVGDAAYQITGAPLDGDPA